jgi:hypothetical protein
MSDRLQLAAQFIGQLLDMLGEVRLHLLGQLQSLILFQYPGKSALAALRIDADHRFIAAAQIGGIDRQIGDFPQFVILGVLRGKALLDRILMAAGKGREHQFAAIGVARVDGQLVAIFNRVDDLINVREIDLGINALRVEVEPDGDEAAIASAFTIAEQAAFHPVRARHQAQFGGGNAGATVIVRVQLK